MRKKPHWRRRVPNTYKFVATIAQWEDRDYCAYTDVYLCSRNGHLIARFGKEPDEERSAFLSDTTTIAQNMTLSDAYTLVVNERKMLPAGDHIGFDIDVLSWKELMDLRHSLEETLRKCRQKREEDRWNALPPDVRERISANNQATMEGLLCRNVL